MIAAVERIAAAVDLPVTADLEAGYGDVEATVRRAIGAGAVGGNIEDEMRPLDESAAAMAAAVRAGEAEGVPFVLNARTDAYLLAGDRDPEEVFADAVARGRAFLDVGADCVFVPGASDAETIGRRKVSIMISPGSLPLSELSALGVARVSCGPYAHHVALTAYADVATDLLTATGPFPTA